MDLFFSGEKTTTKRKEEAGRTDPWKKKKNSKKKAGEHTRSKRRLTLAKTQKRGYEKEVIK